ncbi:MAG: AAA family ATPase [Rhodospirillales bacterium]|jgi:predicted ATPase|nr:AAA family ATPase [Rhodospirillales bacterium]
MFCHRLALSGLLSFAPDSEPIELQPLNVLIGPNGAGKSNFVEAFELLRATPTDFAQAIRDGGGAGEWIWKGKDAGKTASIDAIIGPFPKTARPIRYRLEFTDVNQRVEILDEAIEETEPVNHRESDVFFYYRFQRGHPVINVRHAVGGAGALNEYLSRFFPRYERISTRVSGGPCSSTCMKRDLRPRFRQRGFPTGRSASSRCLPH